MSTQITPLLEQLKLNTRLFVNALEGVDEETARKRPGAQSNNMAFIALHILDARCYLAGYVGLEFEFPFEGFEDVRSVDEVDEFPPLADVRAVWGELSGRLGARFLGLEDAELGEKSPQQFPVEDDTVLGGIAFLLGHEAFHIGQLAFLRKFHGLEALRY